MSSMPTPSITSHAMPPQYTPTAVLPTQYSENPCRASTVPATRQASTKPRSGSQSEEPQPPPTGVSNVPSSRHSSFQRQSHHGLGHERLALNQVRPKNLRVDRHGRDLQVTPRQLRRANDIDDLAMAVSPPGPIEAEVLSRLERLGPDAPAERPRQPSELRHTTRTSAPSSPAVRRRVSGQELLDDQGVGRGS